MQNEYDNDNAKGNLPAAKTMKFHVMMILSTGNERKISPFSVLMRTWNFITCRPFEWIFRWFHFRRLTGFIEWQILSGRTNLHNLQVFKKQILSGRTNRHNLQVFNKLKILSALRTNFHRLQEFNIICVFISFVVFFIRSRCRTRCRSVFAT